MTVVEDKATNIARAASLVKEAACKGAQLIALPVRVMLDTRIEYSVGCGYSTAVGTGILKPRKLQPS